MAFPTKTSGISEQNKGRFGRKQAAFQMETSGVSDGNKRRFDPLSLSYILGVVVRVTPKI